MPSTTNSSRSRGARSVGSRGRHYPRRGSWRGSRNAAPSSGRARRGSSRTSSRGTAGRRTTSSRATSTGRTPNMYSASSSRIESASNPSTPAPVSARGYSQCSSAPGHSSLGNASAGDPDLSGIHEALGSADPDLMSEVVMALSVDNHRTIGCAYYAARFETLFVMEDLKMGSIDVIDLLKLQVEPTVVLVPSKIEDDLLEHLDPDRGESCWNTVDGNRSPYQLEVRPWAEFRPDAAKSKLLNLKLRNMYTPLANFVIHEQLEGHEFIGSDDENSGSHGQWVRLAGLIDVESDLSVACAGAVISCLQRRRAASYLPGDESGHSFFRIVQVESFSLKNAVFINSDTLQSLQIIQTESHPHTHNQGPHSSGSKEGFSVFGLFYHLIRTQQGRQLLRSWLLRPSMDLDMIEERQHSIATFIRPDNSTQVDDLQRHLKFVQQVRPHILKLRKGVCANGSNGTKMLKTVWSVIRLFVFHALKIRDLIQEISGSTHLPIRTKILEKFETHHLAQIGRQISDIVDFEQTEIQRRIVVKPGIDFELDNMKRLYDGLEHLLTEVSKAIAHKIPPTSALLNIIYFPQLGFLIACRTDSDAGSSVMPGDEVEGWDLIFFDADVVYYKSPEMKEMDQKFGDLFSMICDREIEILHGLAQTVLQYDDVLTAISDICGELDCLLALTQGAKQYNLCRPHLTRDNVIRIRGGRHILQELTVGSFVANDTVLIGGNGNISSSSAEEGSMLGGSQCHGSSSSMTQPSTIASSIEGPAMLIMTGPNYSGKSVFLKQVALIVFMAHVGSFVPAVGADIGLTDKILTRISTRESVSKVQSSFMIDLQQTSLALNLATQRSLLILDEFGKGTESNDGAGLACGVLEHLLSLGENCPKVVAATHFHEMFESGFLSPSPQLMFGHMQVEVDSKAAQVSDQITYLYNLRLGRSISSFGTLCAAMNGVGSEVVRRAEELIVLEARGEDLVAACSVPPESEAAELHDAEQIARAFLAADVSIEPRRSLNSILEPSSKMSLSHSIRDDSSAKSVIETTEH